MLARATSVDVSFLRVESIAASEGVSSSFRTVGVDGFDMLLVSLFRCSNGVSPGRIFELDRSGADGGGAFGEE